MKEDIKEVFSVAECRISNASLLLPLYWRQKLIELFLKNDNQKLNSEYIHCRNQSFPSIKFSKTTKKTFTTRTHTHTHKIFLLLPNNGMPKSAKIFRKVYGIKSFVVFSSRKWNFVPKDVIPFIYSFPFTFFILFLFDY